MTGVVMAAFAVRRMSLLAKVSFLVLVSTALFSAVVARDNVPAVIWGSKSLVGNVDQPSALAKFSTSDFSEKVLQKLHDYLVVFFVQDTLSVEDFSIVSGEGGSTALPNVQALMQESGSFFLPQVHHPTKLSSVLVAKEYQPHHLKFGGDPTEINLSHQKNLVVVKLKDTDEDMQRDEVLRENDKEIGRIYAELKKNFPDVTGIFSAHHPSWVLPDEGSRRHVREVVDDGSNVTTSESPQEPTTTEPTTTVESVTMTAAPEPQSDEGNYAFYSWKDSNGQIYFYAVAKPLLFFPDDKAMPNITLAGNVETKGDFSKNTATLHVNYTNFTNATAKENFEKIYLKVLFTMGRNRYWSLTNMTVGFVKKPKVKYPDGEVEMNTTTEIIAPATFSYHCVRKIVYRAHNVSEDISDLYGKIYLVLEGLQVQPYNITGNKFGDGYDCVGFFSIGILAGLFVTSIMCAILLWALCMIVDIKTMDRFDDPKGKMLVIGGAEG